jgi:Lon protease-like protein
VARTLPLFPLPVVLFPGVMLPLHIFEPRYRRMLGDCLAEDRRFGLVFLPEGTAERELPRGHVGCIAYIERAEELPDGRSNIAVSGEERFALARFVDSPLPYHLVEVADYADEPEPQPVLDSLAAEVRAVFERVARAARIITEDRARLPELPEEAALLAFRIASLIDIDATRRQQLLTSRSPLARLRDIEQVLTSAVDPLEKRAKVHQRAKLNGRGYGPEVST